MAGAQNATDRDVALYCADQVRRYDHDRYLCALFAPEPSRPHLFALYAFNIEVAKVREVIREPMMGQIRLQWWREAIERALTGDPRHHPVALALAEAIRVRSLPHASFERLLDAREFDLSEGPPEDLAALEAYAEATSSTLVQLSLAVLGEWGEKVQEAGRHAGIAWALTGLLRAVPFHAAQRRLYLPNDLLRRQGVRSDRLFEGRPEEGLTNVARIVAERAREHLAQARALRRHVPRGAVPALLPARLADLHLGRLERRGFALFDPALQRPAADRALRLAWAALRGRY